MRNISKSDELSTDVGRLREFLRELGRRSSLRDPVSSVVEEAHITPPQAHAVLWVGTEGPLTMGEIAQRVGISEKTVTGVVDRLERDDLIQRERDEADRRVVRCRLTRAGEALYQRLDALMTNALTQFLALLEPKDRKDLLRVLSNLTDTLRTKEEKS